MNNVISMSLAWSPMAACSDNKPRYVYTMLPPILFPLSLSREQRGCLCQVRSYYTGSPGSFPPFYMQKAHLYVSVNITFSSALGKSKLLMWTYICWFSAAVLFSRIQFGLYCNVYKGLPLIVSQGRRFDGFSSPSWETKNLD